MIAVYCEDHHQSRGTLCDECQGLFEYAQARLGRCPWGEDKPVCANCSIHCYKPSMRDQVREVMRYAGPKMLLRHPVLGRSGTYSINTNRRHPQCGRHTIQRQPRMRFRECSAQEADPLPQFQSV